MVLELCLFLDGERVRNYINVIISIKQVENRRKLQEYAKTRQKSGEFSGKLEKYSRNIQEIDLKYF